MASKRAARVLGVVVLLSAMTAGPASAAGADLSGKWKGTWESCVTGHKGPLKAEFCRIGADRYRVTFRGRFLKFVPFRYSVVLRVVSETEDAVVLRGSADLGRLAGGRYYYVATATSCSFRANYRSCEDRGYFALRR